MYNSPTCAIWCWKWAGWSKSKSRMQCKALSDENLSLAHDVIARDQIINGLQRKADEDSVSMIALRQPLGQRSAHDHVAVQYRD
jgi:phosphate uptake regulator